MASLPKSALSILTTDDQPARIDGAGLTICERPERQKVILRGDGGDVFNRTVRGYTGTPLPMSADDASQDDPCCIFLSETEWLITAGDRPHLYRELAAVAQTMQSAVFNANSAWVAMELTGNAIPDLLASGCRLDLHPGHFGAGTFRTTEIAKVPVIIYRHKNKGGFDIYVERSLAMELWLWFRDTAKDMAQ